MKNEMTYAVALTSAIEMMVNAGMTAEAEKLTALRAQVTKPKSSKPSAKDIAKAKEDAELQDILTAFLQEQTEPMTAKQILTACPSDKVAVLSVSKVAYLLTKMDNLTMTVGKRGVHMYAVQDAE